MFPLLEFAVQEAQAQARGARQRQRRKYRVDPDVVDDDLVVHQPAVHVDGPVRAVALMTAADHGRDHGRGGRGDRLRRGCRRVDRLLQYRGVHICRPRRPIPVPYGCETLVTWAGRKGDGRTQRRVNVRDTPKTPRTHKII